MAHVEDQLAILDLLSRYAFALDFRDSKSWVDCFTPDGSFENIGRVKAVGVEQLKSLADQLCARKFDIRHFVTNQTYEVEGTTARGKCYVLVCVAQPGETAFKLGTPGVYQDKLVKEQGRWRFCERILLEDVSLGLGPTTEEVAGR